MKLLNISFVFLILFIASCGVTPQDAVLYNNRIIELDSSITVELDTLIASVDSLDSSEYYALYEKFSTNLEYSLKRLDSISSFYGDNELYIAARKLFLNYLSLSENELIKLRKIVEMPDSAYNSETDSSWQYISYQINKNLDINVDSFLIVQERFIKKYDLNKDTVN